MFEVEVLETLLSSFEIFVMIMGASILGGQVLEVQWIDHCMS